MTIKCKDKACKGIITIQHADREVTIKEMDLPSDMVILKTSVFGICDTCDKLYVYSCENFTSPVEYIESGHCK